MNYKFIDVRNEAHLLAFYFLKYYAHLSDHVTLRQGPGEG